MVGDGLAYSFGRQRVWWHRPLDEVGRGGDGGSDIGQRPACRAASKVAGVYLVVHMQMQPLATVGDRWRWLAMVGDGLAYSFGRQRVWWHRPLDEVGRGGDGGSDSGQRPACRAASKVAGVYLVVHMQMRPLATVGDRWRWLAMVGDGLAYSFGRQRVWWHRPLDEVGRGGDGGSDIGQRPACRAASKVAGVYLVVHMQMRPLATVGDRWRWLAMVGDGLAYSFGRQRVWWHRPLDEVGRGGDGGSDIGQRPACRAASKVAGVYLVVHMQMRPLATVGDRWRWLAMVGDGLAYSFGRQRVWWYRPLDEVGRGGDGGSDIGQRPACRAASKVAGVYLVVHMQMRPPLDEVGRGGDGGSDIGQRPACRAASKVAGVYLVVHMQMQPLATVGDRWRWLAMVGDGLAYSFGRQRVWWHRPLDEVGRGGDGGSDIGQRPACRAASKVAGVYLVVHMQMRPLATVGDRWRWLAMVGDGLAYSFGRQRVWWHRPLDEVGRGGDGGSDIGQRPACRAASKVAGVYLVVHMQMRPLATVGDGRWTRSGVVATAAVTSASGRRAAPLRRPLDEVGRGGDGGSDIGQRPACRAASKVAGVYLVVHMQMRPLATVGDGWRWLAMGWRIRSAGSVCGGTGRWTRSGVVATAAVTAASGRRAAPLRRPLDEVGRGGDGGSDIGQRPACRAASKVAGVYLVVHMQMRPLATVGDRWRWLAMVGDGLAYSFGRQRVWWHRPLDEVGRGGDGGSDIGQRPACRAASKVAGVYLVVHMQMRPLATVGDGWRWLAMVGDGLAYSFGRQRVWWYRPLDEVGRGGDGGSDIGQRPACRAASKVAGVYLVVHMQMRPLATVGDRWRWLAMVGDGLAYSFGRQRVWWYRPLDEVGRGGDGGSDIGQRPACRAASKVAGVYLVVHMQMRPLATVGDRWRWLATGWRIRSAGSVCGGTGRWTRSGVVATAAVTSASGRRAAPLRRPLDEVGRGGDGGSDIGQRPACRAASKVAGVYLVVHMQMRPLATVGDGRWTRSGVVATAAVTSASGRRAAPLRRPLDEVGRGGDGGSDIGQRPACRAASKVAGVYLVVHMQMRPLATVGDGRWTRSGVVATAAVTSASGRRAAPLRRPLDEVGRGGDGGSDIGQRPACRAASKVAGVYLVVHMQMRPLATVGDGWRWAGDGLAYSFGRQRVWWHRPLDEVGRGGDGGSDIGQRPACRAASKVAGVYLVVHMQMRPLATVGDGWRWAGDGLAYSFGRQRVWWHRPLDEVGRGGDGGSDIGQRPACRAASKVAGVYLVVHMQMQPLATVGDRWRWLAMVGDGLAYSFGRQRVWWHRPLDEVGRGGDGGSDIGQRPACRAASKVAGVYLVVHMQMRPLATVGDRWRWPLDEVGRGGDGGSDIGQRPACRAASKVAGVYLVVHMQMRPPLDEVGRGGDGGSDIGQRPACRAASKVAGVYLVVHMQMQPLATVGDRWRWLAMVGDGLAYSFGRQRVWWHRPLDEVGRGGDGGSDIGQRPACRAASKVAGVYLVVHMPMRPLATVGDGRWTRSGVVATAAVTSASGRRAAPLRRPLDEVGRGGDGGSDIGQRPACRAASKVAGVYLVVHMQMRPLATVGDGRWTRSGVVATAAVTSASGRRAAPLRRPLDEVGRGGDGGSDIGQRPACRAASKVAGVYLVVHMQMRPLATVGDGRWTRSGVVATAAVTSASGRRAAPLRRPLDEVGRGGDGGSDIGQRPACRAASKVAGVYLVVHMQMQPLATVGDRWRWPLDEVGRGGDGGSDIGQRPACRAASKVAGVYLVVHMQMRPPLDEVGRGGDGGSDIGQRPACRAASKVAGVYLVVHMQMQPLATVGDRWRWLAMVGDGLAYSFGRQRVWWHRPLDEVGRGGDGGSDIGQRPACRAASKVAGVYLVVHMQMRPLATVGDGRWTRSGVVATAAVTSASGRRAAPLRRPLDEVGRGGDGGSDIGQRPACRAASKVAGVYLVVHMQMQPLATVGDRWRWLAMVGDGLAYSFGRQRVWWYRPLDEVGRGGDGGSDIGQRPACRAASKVAGVYLVVHMQMQPLATVGDRWRWLAMVGDGLAYSFGRQRVWWHRPLDEVGRGGDGGSDIGQRPACRAASKVAGVYLVVHMQMRPLATVGDGRWTRSGVVATAAVTSASGRRAAPLRRPLDEVGRGGDGGSDIGQRPACRAASKVAGVYLVVHMQMQPLATVGDRWRWLAMVGDGLAYSFGRQRVWWYRPLDEVGRGGDGGSDIGQRPACRAASKVAGVYLVVHMQMQPLATVGDRWRWLAMVGDGLAYSFGRQRVWWYRPLDEVGRGGDGGSDIGQRPACRAASKVAGVYLVVHMQMRPPLDEVGRGGDGGSDIGQRPACRAASKVAGVYLVVHMQMRPLSTVGDGWRWLATGWRIRSAGSVCGDTGRWTRSGVVATAAVTSASGRRAAPLRRPLDEVGRGGDGGSDIGQRPACRAASKVAGVYLVVHMQMRPLATVGDRWRWLAMVGDGLAYSFGRQRVWWHRPLDEVGRGGDGGSDIGQRPACRAASKVAGVYLVVHMQMRPPLDEVGRGGDGGSDIGQRPACRAASKVAGVYLVVHMQMRPPLDEVGRGGDGGSDIGQRPACRAASKVAGVYLVVHMQMRPPLDEVGRGGDGGSDIGQRPACRAASKVAGVYLVVHMQMRPPLDEVGRGGDGGSDIGQRPACRAASKVAGVYLVVHMQMRPPLDEVGRGGDGGSDIGQRPACRAASKVAGVYLVVHMQMRPPLDEVGRGGDGGSDIGQRPACRAASKVAGVYLVVHMQMRPPLDEVGRGGDGGSDIGQRPACRAASKVAGVYLVVHMQMRPLATVGDGRWTRSGVVATAAVTSASGRRAAPLRRPLDEVGRGGDGGSDIGQRPACRAASKVAGVYLVVHMQMRPPLDEVGRGGDGGSDIGQRPACRAASKVAGVYLVVHMQMRPPLDEVGRGGDGGSDIGQRPACRAASKVAGVYLVVHMQMRPLATVGDRWRWLAMVGDGLAYSFGRQRVWWHRPLDEVGRGGDGGSDIGQRPACRAASKVAGVYLVVHMQMRPLATVGDGWRWLAMGWRIRSAGSVCGGTGRWTRSGVVATAAVTSASGRRAAPLRRPLDEVGRGGDGGSDIGQRPACRAASKVAGVYLVVHMQMRPLATVGDRWRWLAMVGDGLAYSFGRQRVWWHRPLDEVGRGGDGGSDIGQRPACRAASKVAGVYLVVHMQMRPLATVGDGWRWLAMGWRIRSAGSVCGGTGRWTRSGVVATAAVTSASGRRAAPLRRPLDEVGRGGDGGSDIGQRPACRAASKVAGVYLVVHMQMRPLATVGDRWRWPLDEVGRGGDGGSDIGQRPACRAASKVAGVYLVVHMQMRPLATVGDGWRWAGDGLAYSFGRQRVWWYRPLDEVGRGGDGGSDIGQRPACRAASKVAGVYLVVHMQMRPLATVGDGRWTRSGVVATAAVTSASGRRAAPLRRPLDEVGRGGDGGSDIGQRPACRAASKRWAGDGLAMGWRWAGDGLAYSFGRQRVWWHRPLDEVGRGGDGGSDIGQRPACRAASKVAGVYLVVHMQMRPLATVGDRWRWLAMGWRIRSAGSVCGGTGRWTRSGVVATAAVTSASGRRAAPLRRPLDEVGRGGDGGSDIGQRPACRAASKVAGVYLVVHMQMRPLATVGDGWRWAGDGLAYSFGRQRVWWHRPLDEVGRGGDGGSDIGQRPACRAASKVAGVYLVVHMQMRPLATVGDRWRWLAMVGDGLAYSFGRQRVWWHRPLDEVGRGGDGGSDIGQRPACRAASKVAGVYLVVHMQMRPLATVGDRWRWLAMVGDGLAYSFGRQRVWWYRPLDEVGRGGDGGSDIGQRPACRAASKVAGVYLVVHMQMRPLAMVSDGLAMGWRIRSAGSVCGGTGRWTRSGVVATAAVTSASGRRAAPLRRPLDEVGRGGDGGSDIGQRPACRAASKVAGVYLVVHMQMRPLATVGDGWRWAGDGLAYSFGRQRVWWYRPLDEVGRGGDGGSDIGQRPACRAASKVAGVYLVVHMQMRPLATVGDRWRWPLDEVGRGGDGGSDIGQRPACRAASKVAGVYLVVHMQMRPLATVGDGRWTRSGVVATAAVTSASGRRAAPLRRPLDEVGRGGDGGSDIGQRPACRAASKVAGVYLVVHMQMRPLATVGDG
ncbi:hypothetical protein PRIC2_008780 [Phytophthora ramorum]